MKCPNCGYNFEKINDSNHCFICLNDWEPLHVMPIDDEKEHHMKYFCGCDPRLIYESGTIIVVHNSYDGREAIEEANEIINNMNTYTEADLISFGKFLLSEERESSLRETNNINPEALPYEERFKNVYDADLANWKESVKDI